MSDYRVLEQVSLHLRGLLFEGLGGDDEVGEDFTAETTISLASPVEILERPTPDTPVLLSLYLYQVAPNPHVRNHAPIPHGPFEQRQPPLALDLSYLLTPLHRSPTERLVVLGRAMQILEANATLRAGFLQSDLRPRTPELRLLLEPIPLEELTRIWNAFNRPYQLSVSYRAQFVAIDSAREPAEGPPVVEGVLDVHQLNGSRP